MDRSAPRHQACAWAPSLMGFGSRWNAHFPSTCRRDMRRRSPCITSRADFHARGRPVTVSMTSGWAIAMASEVRMATGVMHEGQLTRSQRAGTARPDAMRTVPRRLGQTGQPRWVEIPGIRSRERDRWWRSRPGIDRGTDLRRSECRTVPRSRLRCGCRRADITSSSWTDGRFENLFTLTSTTPELKKLQAIGQLPLFHAQNVIRQSTPTAVNDP